MLLKDICVILWSPRYACGLLLLSVLLSHMLNAQTLQQRFGRVTQNDGLSSHRVYDIAQDRKGFLWIGTLEGLDRYDGSTVRTFRHDERDSSTISFGGVTGLLVDRNGIIWAGTIAGELNRFDTETERFTRYPHIEEDSLSFSGGRITTIYEDRSGAIWIGTRGGGLNKLVRTSEPEGSDTSKSNQAVARHQLRFLHFRHSSSTSNCISSDTIHAIFEDNEGMLWLGTDDGLDALDRKSATFLHYKNSPSDQHSISNNSVRAIYEDRSGILWVGTEVGLNRFDVHTAKFTRYFHDPRDRWSIGSDEISSMNEADGQSLWVGTLSGLSRLDRATSRFARYKPNPTDEASLTSDYIRAIRTDRSGVMWIVTDQGLNKVTRRSQQFKHYTNEPDLRAKNDVSAIWVSETTNTLWLGGWTSGLTIITVDGVSKRFHQDPKNPRSLSSNIVMSLFQDQSGVMWIGTAKALDRYDDHTQDFTHFSWAVKGDPSSIMAICEDNSGHLWLGTTEDGVIQFDTKTKESVRYMSDPGKLNTLSHNVVRGILLGRDDALWIATEGGGLNELDLVTKQFNHFRHDPPRPRSLTNNNISALAKDQQGSLWMSTWLGLNRFEMATETFEQFIIDSSKSVKAHRILEDKNGYLWFSTMQDGIYRFDPNSKRSQHFDVADGLQSNQFSYAGFVKQNGEILVGGENGFNVFHPDSIMLNTHPPPVVLTSFRIFDVPAKFPAPLTAIREITLAYNQNFFSFEFAALDYTTPTKNRYAYKLEGLDPHWVYPQDRRVAVYTNVDPGEYILRVKGSNNDGIWNEQGLSIPLTITPPFWATWWFRSLMALLTIAILTGAYQYRVSQLLEMERMRVRIASDLHDDIGSSLSSIALITDMVRNHLPPDQKDRQYLMDAGHAARHTADALKDIVWIINPENDKLDDIVLRMKDSAAKLLLGIDYGFDCQENAMSSVLDMEFRRNVLLIYKETLNNIAKYAHATKVEIAVREADKVLNLRVTDNGIGFDEATITRGNGLKNLRARAAKMGGTIEIKSIPGKGTTVQLDARIP